MAVNVLQTVALHLCKNPVQSIFQALRSAEPVSKCIGEFCESIPGGTVGKRCVYEGISDRSIFARIVYGKGFFGVCCRWGPNLQLARNPQASRAHASGC